MASAKNDDGNTQVVDKPVDKLPNLPAYIPGQDWDSLTDGADEVMGADLARDELFDALEGVPFLIHSLTFRKGFSRPWNGSPRAFAYVSCEAVIPPTEVLTKRRVDLAKLPFDSGSNIVFNDGSTGIYRQIVGYLSARGMIVLPEGLPEGGPHGESRYDLSPAQWAGVTAGELTFDVDGWADYSVNVRLKCPRGIRLSEYANDYSPDGSKTRYLA